MRTITEEQLLLLQAAIADERERRLGDELQPDPQKRTLARIHKALIAAALTLAEVGDRLRSTQQYLRHKPNGAPAMSTIYRHYPTFEDALVAAGLTGHQPMRALLRGAGRGKGRSDYDYDDCVRAMALALNYFFGRRFSQSDYDREFRATWTGGPLPSCETICKHSSKKGAGGSWDEMHAAAGTLVLGAPDLYPQAAIFLLIGREA